MVQNEMLATSPETQTFNDRIIPHHYRLPEIERSELKDYVQIGSGTYGSVFKAHWIPQDRTVAVKKLFLLEKEASMLARLRHKNIIQFLGIVPTHPDFAIVTEFAEKGSLYHYLADENNDSLNFGHILRWAIDIARGVHYLHFESPEKILHRDLKSKNVVISADDLCKLCDFGDSRAVSGNTAHMSMVGTVPWMSPEMINQKEKITEGTDVWSYAVVLWELLTREEPFKGLSEFRIQMGVVEQGVRLIIPQSCPALLSRLITDCWRTAPMERPDFGDILKRLDQMSDDTALSIDADLFLKQKESWKQEISAQISQLKDKENELNAKEEQLRAKERTLKLKEQRMNNSFATPQLRRLPSTDVNDWDEVGVVEWLCSTHAGIATDDLLELKRLVYMHHINGRRLLMLTDWDLWHLGINSIGRIRELVKELNQLKFDNSRLRNFPSLNESQRALQYEADQKKAKEMKVFMELKVLYYGGARRDAYSDVRRYKVLLDGDWSMDDEIVRQLPDDVRGAPAAVLQSVTVSTRSHDVIKLNSDGPFVCPVFLESFVGEEVDGELHFVVNYSDRVIRPRNTRFSVRVSDYNSDMEVLLKKVVELTLRPFLTKKQKAASPAVADEKLIHSESSPQLAGVWKNRHYWDTVVPPDNHNSPTTSSSRSSLWSEIASSLRATPTPSFVREAQADTATSSSMGLRKHSMPTPSPRADDSPGVSSLSGGLFRMAVSEDNTQTTARVSPRTPRRGYRGRVRHSKGRIAVIHAARPTMEHALVSRQLARPNSGDLVDSAEASPAPAVPPVRFSLSAPVDELTEVDIGIKSQRSNSDVVERIIRSSPSNGEDSPDGNQYSSRSSSGRTSALPAVAECQGGREEVLIPQTASYHILDEDQESALATLEDTVESGDEAQDSSLSQLSRKVHGGYGKWVWKKT